MRRLALCLACAVLPATAAADTTFLLVRHAEKVDGSANPDLSSAGLARAERLAEIAEQWGVNAVYSTDFCRTAQTGMAVARSRRMPIVVQSVSRGRGGIERCRPPLEVPVIFLDEDLDSAQELAEHLLGDQAGRVVLLVGHSNTVPELVAALGGGDLPALTIGDEEYDRLFVVTVPADGAAAQLLEQHYGDP